MDLSVISAAATSLTMAKDLAKAAIGLRDFNQVSLTIAQLNDQLLKAQDALFKHQSDLLVIQQQHLETTQKLAKAEKALAERNRYSLFELSTGVFVYRMNVAPVDSHVGDPVAPEPTHYVCQSCYDKGIKVVLRRITNFRSVSHYCSGCRTGFLEQAASPETQPEPKPELRWTHDH